MGDIYGGLIRGRTRLIMIADFTEVARIGGRTRS